MACISYVDEFSAGRDSDRDLEIGHRHNVAACNSGHVKACGTGDLVVVRSRLRFYVGLLLGKSNTIFPHWEMEGGRTWALNYHCVPITDIHYIRDVEIESKHKLFNSRFCTLKLKNLIEVLAHQVGVCRIDPKYDALLDIMGDEPSPELKWIMYRVYIWDPSQGRSDQNQTQ